MQTNREWLYSLDPLDLSAWFDAPHLDGDSRKVDELSRKCADFAAAYYQACRERDEMREKLSRLTDLAHEIQRTTLG